MALAWVRLAKLSNSRMIVCSIVVDMPNWYYSGPLSSHCLQTSYQPFKDDHWACKRPLRLDSKTTPMHLMTRTYSLRLVPS